MSLRVVRLGTSRQPREGLRIGTVRGAIRCADAIMHPATSAVAGMITILMAWFP